MKVSVKKLVTMGLLAAISIVLVSLVHFSIFPPAPFLEYDPADVPILIGTFLYGPWSGLLLTVLVSVIQGVTVSASSGIIGIVMHILATGAYVLIAGLLYQWKKTRTVAAAGLICGTVAMSAVMCLMNLIFTPLFMGQSLQDVAAMLIPVILPFNLLKAGLNAVVTFILYKPVANVLRLEKHTAVS